MKELKLLLKKFFGYDSFRPMQAEVIEHILKKEDAMVLMPTGGGKSICYQLPAIYQSGMALVISPLIALMKDQVEGLVANGIPAATLNSLIPEEEQQRVKQHSIQGKIKLLYISPERILLELDWFISRLDLSLIAIDEAHCVSRWGHDFRPEYTQLSILKERFPNVPVVALTATADKVTRQDIIKQLHLHNPKIFISSFDRPNLSLTVYRGFAKKQKVNTIVRFIRLHAGQSGIIYCMRRADTESLATELVDKYGISAKAYHAGLSSVEREDAQNEFINDQVDVICATVAFGMGIDKSNVRWVIHYNMPGSIESYYQEIGRAGRDGLKSDTILFYSVGDLIVQRHFVEESGQQEVNLEKLDFMKRYCEANICRRRILLSYFGEAMEHDCGNCDVCKNPPRQFDGSILVQKALSAMVRTEERIGMKMLIDILRGSVQADLLAKGYDRLKTYGVGRDLPYKYWTEYIYQMIQLGYIEIDYVNDHALKMTPLGRKVLYGECKAQLSVYVEPEEVKTASKKTKQLSTKEQRIGTIAFKKQSIRLTDPTLQKDKNLFDALKQLRRQLANRDGIKPYMVFSVATLEEMAEMKPTTLEDFGSVRGVGQYKLERYGTVFVSLIRHTLNLPSL